jgi:hypothetical protein
MARKIQEIPAMGHSMQQLADSYAYLTSEPKPNAGSTNPQLEEEVARFVEFATGEVLRALGRASQT